MAVPMVQVWIVRMLVGHRLMPMWMAVRLARWIAWLMLVLMMLVMNMAMNVLHRLMGMDMGVTLGEMWPCPHRHEHARDHKQQRDGCSQQDDGNHGSQERRSAIVGSGSRGAEVAQGDDEQHQPEAIAHETQRHAADDVAD